MIAEFTEPRLVAIYDTVNAYEPGTQPDFYLGLARSIGARTVLEVGCGTGLIALRMADAGFDVVGLETSQAMLEAARAKPGAEHVRWIHGDTTMLTDVRADLAFMAGHVAQFFLADDAWQEALAGIHRSLAPSGHLAFETRDPRARSWESWTPDRTTLVTDPHAGAIEHWTEFTAERDSIIEYTNHYRFLARDEHLESPAELRFRTEEEIVHSLRRAGFTIDAVYGDWNARPVGPRTEELVFVARRASLTWRGTPSSTGDAVELPSLTDGVVSCSPLLPHEIDEHMAGEDHEIVRWLTKEPATLDSTTAWAKRNLASWRRNGPIRSFAIRETHSGAIVGNIEANWSLDHLAPGEVNVAWAIWPQWRNRGLATRALRLVLRDLAESTDRHTAVAGIHPENHASIRVAQRCGFSLATTTPRDVDGHDRYWFPLVAVALLDRIRAASQRHATKLVAIAGRGGSGKSSLAHAIAGLGHAVSVLKLDDLLTEKGPQSLPGIDWPVVTRVLDDLAAGRPATFRRYDWPTRSLAEELTVTPSETVIFEGVAAIGHPPSIDPDRFDLSIWLECDRATSLERGVGRDGEEHRSSWEDVWVPEEDAYLAAHDPATWADVVVEAGGPAMRLRK